KTAAPPRPIPFSAKQEALEHNPGRPLDRNTEQALRTRIAQQQVNRPGKMAQQEPFGSKPGNNPQPVANPPQQREQMPQAQHGLRSQPRQEVQQQPVNRNAGNGEQMAPQYRNVPRPPQNNNASQPGFRPFGSSQDESHSVPQPPAQGNRQQQPAQNNRPQPGFRSFGSSQGESHSVPQPPARDNRQQQPVQDNRQQPGFGSSASQPHSVPQPPANSGASQRNGRGPQSEEAQPRYQQNQPNSGSGRYDRGGNQGGPAARSNNPQPNSQPARVERPAPRQESAPSGGREVQSRPSNSSAPQHGKQESKDESKPDKRH
ncbi:MAG TPA: hypothetical protein VGR48_13100, partial [Terriglobales bacterium]|nr:hypothetical protein [Terriglobales bacterium]